MRVKVHQRSVTGEVVVGGIYPKVRISNSGARHVDKVDDLLKVRRRMVGVDVVNGEDWMGGKKSKTHCIFNQGNQQIT